MRSKITIAAASLCLVIGGGAGYAQDTTGVTDTEIKLGNIVPYSGPASAFSTDGRVIVAYAKKINDDGGIFGRKINMISLDDAYSPAKAVEATRRLVESDEIFAMFFHLGTAANLATRGYLKAKKVPHLFAGTGASVVTDNPKEYPWLLGWGPDYKSEAVIYSKHLLATMKDPKIAILSQNDDFGRDYLAGLKAGLGDKYDKLVVATATYDTSEPTINSQIITLQSSGANVLFDITTPKFAAQAIKKVAELNWKPVHYLAYPSSGVASVMTPAGVENGEGIISAQYLKDLSDPEWANDQGVKAFKDFMAKYVPGDKAGEINAVLAYTASELLAVTLRQAGKDLSRESLMKAATSLKDVQLSLVLPGILANTSPTQLRSIRCLDLMRFEKGAWSRFGKPVCAE